MILHQTVAAAILFFWARFLGLPSGRSRRFILALVIVLPLFTAAVPGRSGAAFRERSAWLDSSRLLLIPLYGPVLVAHAVAAAAGLAFAGTLWQEVAPALRSEEALGDAPRDVVALARSLPGWSACQVELVAGHTIHAATHGRPGRPHLSVSEGSLERLGRDELAAVVRHEHAHWQEGRWWGNHILFVARVAQAFSPPALVVFREYLVEVEIACDRDAARTSGPKVLARALLKAYRGTRSVSARRVLRKRIEVLLGRVPVADDALPVATMVAAVIILAGVLPWIV